MDPCLAQPDLSALPLLGRIDTARLWQSLPLEEIEVSLPPIEQYLDRHDRWTEKIRLIGLDAGVLVDYRLLPGLDRLVDRLYGQSGWARPEVFVVSDIGRKGIDSWSAVAVLSGSQPVIILGTKLVERLDVQELAFVVGHEAGHLLGYTPAWRRQMSQSFLVREAFEKGEHDKLRRLAPGVDLVRLYQRLLANSRVMEDRCDRLGLLVCGDIRKAASALLSVTLRSTRLGRNISMERYLSVQLPILANSPMAHPISMNAGHPFVPHRLERMAAFSTSGELAHHLAYARR
jgi:Zn-dependent protease with chaperone function